jgi:hypothetical protein
MMRSTSDESLSRLSMQFGDSVSVQIFDPTLEIEQSPVCSCK